VHELIDAREDGYKSSACELTAAQQDALKNWVAQTLPRTTTASGRTRCLEATKPLVPRTVNTTNSGCSRGAPSRACRAAQ
jgi:hypothetical protein